MKQNLIGTLELESTKIYNLDGATNQIQATDLTQKTVVDRTYGGLGEVTSVVPATTQISTFGRKKQPTELQTIVETAKPSNEMVEIPNVEFTNISVNSIKAVVNPTNASV